MFLALAHTKLDVYTVSKSLVLSCYKVSKLLPADERFNMIQQLCRAALSVQLNIAESCSRKSLAERKRYFEIARGSAVEIDAIFDTACELQYFRLEQLTETGNLIIKIFQLLSRMITTAENSSPSIKKDVE